jgi:hypothetical protein
MAASWIAGWATPKVQSGDYQYSRGDRSQIALNLAGQVKLVSGPISNGSPAETGSGGQLNAAFSRYLMGYPTAWCQAAIRAKRTLPTRRKRA